MNSSRKDPGGIGSLFSREAAAQWPAIPHVAIDDITNLPLIGTARRNIPIRSTNRARQRKTRVIETKYTQFTYMRQRKITTISLAIFHRYLTGTDIEILSIKISRILILKK